MVLDFRKNCHIMWFFIVIVGFAMLWGLTNDFYAFEAASLDEESSHTYRNKANLKTDQQYI